MNWRVNWKVGQELESVRKEPITREQLRDYAEASGDKNPIHLEDKIAQAAGFSTVIVHGMISMAFLADCVRRNFPEEGYRVARFRAKFKKVTFPGDSLTCEGKVKSIVPEGSLVISVWARNQKGEVVTDGEASIIPI